MLRHKPEVIGLLLDVEGWASIEDLIKEAESVGKFLSYETISNIVSRSDKVSRDPRMGQIFELYRGIRQNRLSENTLHFSLLIFYIMARPHAS